MMDWPPDTPEVLHGDCVEVMRELPEASIDAVVSDPPYNLSDSGKRDQQCLRSVFADVKFPDDDQRDRPGGEQPDLAAPRSRVSDLDGVSRAIGVDAGVGVPEGAVDLQGAIAEHEVDDGGVPTAAVPQADLAAERDAESGESLGDYVLELAGGMDASFCDGMCSCFTEPGPGLIRVTVGVTSAASGDLLAGSLSRPLLRDDVGSRHDALGQAERSAGVVTTAGAEVCAVLTLDLLGRTGELRVAHGTPQGHPLFQLRRSQAVGTATRAAALPPVLQAGRVGVVGDSADGTITLHAPWHRLKPSRRVGGFMNKAWDGWESPAAYQRWCTAWAEEAFRVMKPGAHIVAFGGTRTYHRLASALEDAGFEIRDSLAWMFGSGFPKSMDVSKAIDKAQGAEREPDTYTGANQLNKVYGENMGGGVTVERGAPATPEAAAWQGWGTALKPAYEPVVLARKPLTGTVASNVLEHGTGALNIDACRIATVGETPAADRRDTSRRTGTTPGSPGAKDGTLRPAFTDRTSAERYTEERPGEQLGRWPANVALSHHPDCRLVGTVTERHPVFEQKGGDHVTTYGDGLHGSRVVGSFDAEVERWDCQPECPVRMLDTQSGSAGGGYGVSAGDPDGHGIYSGGFPRGDMREVGYGDAGGPSRFFHTTPGRWPANVALGHHDSCELIGTRRVRGHQGYPNGPQGNTFTVGGDPDGTRVEPVAGHADEDGMETVEEWACHPDCPVRMLDEQSGDTGASGAVSGREPTSQDGYQGTMYGARTGNDSEHPFYGDTGGASRFFYTAKASRAERNAGLEDLPEVTNPSYQPRTKRCTICGSTSVNGKAHDTGAPTMNCGHPDSAVELVEPKGIRELEEAGFTVCRCSTVKPWDDEKQARRSTSTGSELSPRRGIDAPALTGGSDSSTTGSGNRNTGRSQKATKSTTETGTSSTTDSRTSSSETTSGTSGTTPPTIDSPPTASGSDAAAGAASGNPPPPNTGISLGEAGSVTGSADPAGSDPSSSGNSDGVRRCERCGGVIRGDVRNRNSHPT